MSESSKNAEILRPAPGKARLDIQVLGAVEKEVLMNFGTLELWTCGKIESDYLNYHGELLL